jgi:hypothetical protein
VTAPERPAYAALRAVTAEAQRRGAQKPTSLVKRRSRFGRTGVPTSNRPLNRRTLMPSIAVGLHTKERLVLTASSIARRYDAGRRQPTLARPRPSAPSELDSVNNEAAVCASAGDG